MGSKRQVWPPVHLLQWSLAVSIGCADPTGSSLTPRGARAWVRHQRFPPPPGIEIPIASRIVLACDAYERLRLRSGR